MSGTTMSLRGSRSWQCRLGGESPEALPSAGRGSGWHPGRAHFTVDPAASLLLNAQVHLCIRAASDNKNRYSSAKQKIPVRASREYALLNVKVPVTVRLAPIGPRFRRTRGGHPDPDGYVLADAAAQVIGELHCSRSAGPSLSRPIGVKPLPSENGT